MFTKLLKAKFNLLVDSGYKKKLRQDILSYYAQVPEEELTSEQKEALHFLRHNRLHVFPHSFTEKYKNKEVEVILDKSLGLRYINHEGKKLYFKRSWGVRKIKRSYTYLLLEQDPKSPHLYLTDKYTIAEGDVIVDAGAAEGNFSLSVVEKAKKLYLFETDSEWIEALEATFAPWKEKVEIVNKFVSDKNDEQHVSLDRFFEEKGTVDFIKADVEGAEADLLTGTQTLLKTTPHLKVAITTYHKQHDEEEIAAVLKDYGFRTSYSDGYMIFMYDENIRPPYFRRGLIRAEK